MTLDGLTSKDEDYECFSPVRLRGFAAWGVLAGYFLVETDVSPATALAASNAVTFPPLEKLEHYTTVRRGITREHMLTSPAALSALKAGQPVPTGTHMVFVD